jgi:cytoskeletal protein CcmA (bactofilin family)
MAMFTKRPNDLPNPLPTGYSVIDAQMLVEGDVETAGTLRVDGNMRGNVRRADIIVVATGASITGNVSAREVIVGGAITGNVTAVERIELQATGSVAGDIEAAAINIQEGGKVDGRMSIHPVASSQRSAESNAPHAVPQVRAAFSGEVG